MPGKYPKKLNAAINTSDSLLSYLNWEPVRHSRLKLRDIKHIRVSDSSTLLKTYTYGSKIGQGAFATVVSITEKVTNKEWAMKIINKIMVGTNIQLLQREIQILKMIEHPHIIYLDKVYESPRKLYLVLERCHGELAKLFQQKKQFSERETRKVIKDLTSAVSYLHKNDIVHRDLKLQNILITQNPKDQKDKLFIKLSDFGLSIIKHGSTIEDMLHDYCGTLTYIAPEVIATNSYSQQCDIWSIGVIMYLLLSGEFPFYHNQAKDLADIICNSEPNYNKIAASSDAIRLITKMLSKNPAMRITAVEIEMHPWIIDKPTTTRPLSPENVLDMMKLWRSDMRLPMVEDCDWVSSATNTYQDKTQTHSSPNKSIASEENGRQSIPLPVQNIRFEKRRIDSLDNSSKSEKNSILSNTSQIDIKQRGNSNGMTNNKHDHKRHVDKTPGSKPRTSATRNSTTTHSIPLQHKSRGR